MDKVEWVIKPKQTKPDVWKQLAENSPTKGYFKKYPLIPWYIRLWNKIINKKDNTIN